MFLEKFRSLKSFRQILVRSLSNDARTGKANHALRFSNDHVAQGSKARHDTCSGGIGQNRNVRKLLFRMTRECTARFGHLHQAQHSFVQACAPGRRHDNDGAAFGGSIFNCAGDSLADD